ncbi:MAG: inositol monophosphatase [Phycisphaeraceae bacterium]|nr:inositol monophosphatase [Phycisphaeraceae bacterium]
MTSKTTNHESMLATAIQAARCAGHHALDMMNTTQASIKNNSDLVTEADCQCQTLIIEQIQSRFPGHGFIGEEGDRGGLFKQPPSGPDDIWWIIDPIDGTNNYAHGLPQFSVSIGAMQHGRPIVGVIYDPCADHLYTAASQGEPCDNGVPIAVSDESLSMHCSVGIDSHFGDTIPPWVYELMVRTRFRNVGTTALHLAYTAKGGLAGMTLFTPKLWDIAAGCLIAEQAGAIISDWQGNPLWPMDPSIYEGNPIPSIMCNPVVHKELLAMINGA